MPWYAVLPPAALLAYGIRLYAALLPPYYSWLQVVPYLVREDSGTERQRRRAFRRRVMMPLLVTFLLTLAFPETYTVAGGALIGSIAAGLLLWPMALGQPMEVHGTRSITLLLYAGLFAAFAVSGGLGVHVAQWVREEHGGVIEFIRSELLAGVVVAAFLLLLSDGLTKISTKASDDFHSEH